MNKKYNLLIGLLVVSLSLPALLSDVQTVSAAYYGSVDFTGRVTVDSSGNAISGVTVKLLEDGVVKRSNTTDSNGNYSFTWTIVRYKLYTMEIDAPGYIDQSTGLFFPGPDKNQDFEIDGRVALFLWAPDVANQTVMEELGDQLVDEQGFSDILYRENATDWEDAIDDVDELETSESLVFIYIIAHGPASTYNGQNDYTSYVAHNGGSLVDTNNITSDDLADKLQDLESNNIFLMVEACNTAGFYTEYEYQEHSNDDVFAMTAAFYTQAIRWYGDNGTNFNPDDEDGSAWGGAFTHFYFEGLDLDKTDSQSFTYAYNNANYYANHSLSEHGVSFDQQPQCSDELFTTWFG
jgi:hypothetical protein